jgi:FkbH-like protein
MIGLILICFKFMRTLVLKDLKYTEILSNNKVLGESLANLPMYTISVLSNIITSQLNDILEFAIRSQGINAKVNSGDYDNIVQNSATYAKSNVVIVFWELANIIDGLQYKSLTMTSDEIAALIVKVKQEIDFVFYSLSTTPLVIFNQFSTLIFNQHFLRVNQFDEICNELNQYISSNIPSNFFLIPIDKLFAQVSIARSVDLRYYYSSKALYSIDFLKCYAQFISPLILSVNGKSKKVLVLDCDNTLWKGIIGEDGLEGISLSTNDKNGVFFEEVHHLIKNLSNDGVMVCLCSKNNQSDLDEIWKSRSDFALDERDVFAKKINWQSKDKNLQELIEDLNVGADSLVFVDDSSFEISCVESSLPEVTTLQVPKPLHTYPSLFRETTSLFFKLSQTAEDNKRIEMYHYEARRKNERKKFASIDEYLSSLELKLSIHINHSEHLTRASQLTQKTNQFNLTTKRYTETEIKGLLEGGDHRIYVMEVSDKFGDYGLTGLAIIAINHTEAEIDTFLLSCRVLGRNIEINFVNFIINDLKELGVNHIFANYVKTPKNMQVANFYEKNGFDILSASDSRTEYRLLLNSL